MRFGIVDRTTGKPLEHADTERLAARACLVLNAHEAKNDRPSDRYGYAPDPHEGVFVVPVPEACPEIVATLPSWAVDALSKVPG